MFFFFFNFDLNFYFTQSFIFNGIDNFFRVETNFSGAFINSTSLKQKKHIKIQQYHNTVLSTDL